MDVNDEEVLDEDGCLSRSMTIKERIMISRVTSEVSFQPVCSDTGAPLGSVFRWCTFLLPQTATHSLWSCHNVDSTDHVQTTNCHVTLSGRRRSREDNVPEPSAVGTIIGGLAEISLVGDTW